VLNNIDYWNYFEQDIWQIDSVPIFNLDSLLQGDSTAFVIVFDSTQSTVQDSSLESRIDTSYTKELVKKRNLYKYFEIPLFVQYNFNKGRKFQPFVRLGWVTGLYFRTEGSYVNGSNRVSDLNEAPFIKVSFWANAGLGFSYRYTKHWHAIAFVNYRYNINGIIQRQDYYNQHLDYINFSLGLRYGF
jgi:hypothetical protein